MLREEPRRHANGEGESRRSPHIHQGTNQQQFSSVAVPSPFASGIPMGQGEESKTRPEPQVEIQEKGEIFFFYRPKVSKEEARSANDVQRMYIVLCPESGERPTEEKQEPDSGKEGALSERAEGGAVSAGGIRPKQEEEEEEGTEGGHGSEVVDIENQRVLRFIVMGRKSLPDPSKHSRPHWGFVEIVTKKVEDIRSALKGEEYDTATRGHRRTSPARALAEGIYRILRHKLGSKTHTHLVYKLEFPPEGESREAQESLNVEREGSFLIQIRNPGQKDASRFRGVQSKRRAVFPAHLQGQLGQLRFAPADPPDFLNYEGCEFLLISASDDVEEELGLELRTEQEGTRDAACSDLIKMFGEEAVSSKPLLSGTWV